MRLAPAFAVALAPFAAGALTLTVNGGTSDILVGSNNCSSLSLLAAWNLETAPSAGDHLRVMGVRNPGSCTTNPPSPSPEVPLRDETPTAQTGTATTSANQLALADGGTSGCGDAAIRAATSANPITNVLCAQYIPFGANIVTASVNVKYALAKPTAPTGVAIRPGDSHFRLDWSAGNSAEKIATYDVHVVPQGTPVVGGPAENVSQTNADVDRTDDNKPLQNDAGYDITVVARDVYGNISDPSASQTAFPVRSSDFYEHYREEGGSALGGHGCATGGASAWIAGGALAMALLLRRRRNARNGATLIALFALLAPAAKAAEAPARRFLVGFKMDRYDPKVDSEPGLTGTPYHDVFGARAPPRYQLEFDWEVAHSLGSLLVGATVGFWQNYGKAILVTSPAGNTQSEDTATLNVFPFGLIATYRFDWLADRWERFPFIPYVQLGLMRALWASYNGRGNVVTAPQGGRGSGWTSGYTTALGVAINLNAVDVDLAREAYLDTGIQRTALFAEYGWTHLDNFHSSGALILSDRAWRFGISVEF